MNPSKILIVRLPCKKVYPIGPVYLMSALRRVAPGMSQRLLDLSLIKEERQKDLLLETLRGFRPDVVAFSWRDLQIFSPQDMDEGMRDAFTFFHDPSLPRKLGASFRGLGHMLSYGSDIAKNLGLIRAAFREDPARPVALGGPGVRIFSSWLRQRIPPAVRLFPGEGLEPFFEFLGLDMPESAVEPQVDLNFLATAFPEWTSYRQEAIGVQTKRGCPLSCLYCLYGFLEGRNVRRRDPERVIREIEDYYGRWTIRRFWLADAQLLSEDPDREHLGSILDGLLRRGIDIDWSGYLRVNGLDRSLARLLVRSGLSDLEVSLNSGSQAVLDRLQVGFNVRDVLDGLRVLEAAGYSGRVRVNLSLNAPGETRESLAETIGVVRQIQLLFGADRVIPVIFFLAVQPHTGLERTAIRDGHLAPGYDPLSVWPWDVFKLIYNPPPLGKMIGRCCARAARIRDGRVGERTLSYLEKELPAA